MLVCKSGDLLLATTKAELLPSATHNKLCLTGGPLKDWYDKNPEALGNTCALRLSVALNESGNPIPAGTGTYKGKDGKNYFISVKNMSNYLTKTFGQPTILQSGQNITNSIIWQSNCGWSDATGHLDIIYNGKAGSKYYDVCGTVKYWH